MFESEEFNITCHSCGGLFDAASASPYSQVECPQCEVPNRVKTQFGRYKVNQCYAIGGMSHVLVAKDEALNRDVAIKLLNEEYSKNEKRVAAFSNEAKLTASLSHPNVVKVYSTGCEYGCFYITMEFVSGGDLESRIQSEGKIKEIDLLPLAIQVAEGLKGAQAAQLIHRDIKPANILIDEEGNAKIVDFGLALLTKRGKATPEEIWATPFYVPPESIEGGAEDFRTDMFAFGATFYHALAGVPPCTETEMSARLLREAQQNIIPLEEAADELSFETCQTIDRAMALDPRDRFNSYDDLILSLKNALQVVKGMKPGQIRKTEAQIKRDKQQRWQRTSLMITIVLGVLGAAAMTYLFVNYG